jgi:hypothetical protein
MVPTRAVLRTIREDAAQILRRYEGALTQLRASLQAELAPVAERLKTTWQSHAS